MAADRTVDFTLFGTAGAGVGPQNTQVPPKARALQDAILGSASFSMIATDETGVIQLFNAGAERMLGYTSAEMIDTVGPERIIDAQELMARAVVLSREFDAPIAPGFQALVFKAARGIEDNYEMTCIRKDGSRLPTLVSVTSLREAEGGLAGYLLIVTDNSARMQMEERLRRTEESFRLMVQSVTDCAIVMLDPEGQVQSWNGGAQRILGYAAQEIVGEHFSRFHLTEEIGRGAPQRELDAASAEGRHEVEGWRQRKDGTRFWANVVWTAIRDDGNVLRGFAKLTRDLTAARQVKAELADARSVARKAHVAKSDFLSSMSHEMRTPLNAILGFAQLLESASPPPTPAQTEGIAQILQAGWYLRQLVDEILDLAMIESGRLLWSREPVSLAEVLLECRSAVEPLAQKTGVRVSFPQPSGPRFVKADRTRVIQALVNLLTNAIEYNQAGGSVVVEYGASAPNRVRVSVSDTGAGMAPDKVDLLFQPFNPLRRPAGPSQGTGVGLAVTKRLVELMGGSIGVSSTVGEGSVFWIEFVAATAPQLVGGDVAHATPAQTPVPKDAERRTLLYVEDNPANLKLVERLIARRHDLRLFSAVTGIRGIERARECMPEVILMDINLPDMSGIEALKLLRMEAATAHIPVVAISANAMPHDIEKACRRASSATSPSRSRWTSSWSRWTRRWNSPSRPTRARGKRRRRHDQYT